MTVPAATTAKPTTTPAPAPAATTVQSPAAAAPSKSQQWARKLGDVQRLQETQDQLKALQPQAQALEALKAKVKSDPLGAMADMGLEWNEVARAKARVGTGAPAAAEKEPAPETKVLTEKVTTLEKRLTEAEQAKVKEAEQTQEQQWNTFVASVDTSIKADPKYKMINRFGATSLVITEIEQAFVKEKKTLTPAAAAEIVEKKMRDEIRALRTSDPEFADELRELLAAEAPKEKQRPGGERGERKAAPPPPKPAIAQTEGPSLADFKRAYEKENPGAKFSEVMAAWRKQGGGAT